LKWRDAIIADALAAKQACMNKVRNDRSKPAREALAKKVATIRSMVVSGLVPDGTPELRTIEQVRTWVDPSDPELRTWSSFSVAAPSGPNADLRAELDEWLPRLTEQRAGGRQGKGPRRGKPITQIQLERERATLARQNDDLICELDDERTAKQRALDLVEIQKQQISELTAALNKITRLESVSVK
jgi:hypothetical protein